MVEKNFIINESNTAKTMGSGGLEVLASPALVTFMENLAFTTLEKECQEHQTSVGVLFNLDHLKPSLVGETVTILITSKSNDGKCVTFNLEAYCNEVLIAKAIHKRVIITKEKFLRRLFNSDKK